MIRADYRTFVVVAVGLTIAPEIVVPDEATHLEAIEAQIDSLRTERQRFDSLSTVLQNEIRRLAALRDSLAAGPVDSAEALLVPVRLTAKLYSQPRHGSSVLGVLAVGTIVRVHEYAGVFFEVTREDTFGATRGFVDGLYLPDDARLVALKELKRRENRSRREAALADELEAELQAKRKRQARIRATYGEDIGDRILRRRIWLGMTTDMALESRGQPVDTNRTVTAHGVHEQWVYRDLYLYFDDGVLTSWQD